MTDPIRASDTAVTRPTVGTGTAPAVAQPTTEDFEVSLESLNQWQLAWRRFKRHRLALIGLGVLAVMVSMAILGPILWPYNPTDIPGVSQPGGDPPTLSPVRNLFGTDFGGRSVLQFIVVGARISVAVGFFTSLIATIIGVTIGAIAGYFGGRVDNLLMRVVDLMLAIPFLFVILVAARFFGGGDPLVLILIFGLLSWPGLARLVRALYLSLRESEFVLAAKAVGVSDLRITFRHILPNALGPVVVSSTLILANAIVLEAFVSFLNFGIRATDVSWGNALSNSKGYLLQGNWWWPFFPGMVLAMTVIAVNFLGDGLRDALDPRSKEV
ncbi:MAG TPA: ABC transporter permease [Candidatus Limnocylindrales bacterium]|nr:ABC transporter permease [Candidatus Limnocylindrales bacterium]